MPIFGLAWVASWVGCFFSSSQDLLKAPPCQARVLSIEPASSTHSPQNQIHAFLAREQKGMATSVSRSEKGVVASTKSVSDRKRNHSPIATSTVVAPARRKPFNFLPYQFAQPALESGSIFDIAALLQTLKEALGGKPSSSIPPQATPIAVHRSVHTIATDRLLTLEHEPDAGCLLTEPQQQRGGSKPFFAVSFRAQFVGKVADEQQAILISRRLEQVLTKPGLKPTQLEPGLLNGQPVVKLNDVPIVALDLQLTRSGNCSASALASAWVHNLRTALIKSPPSLVEIQEKTLGLQETNQTIEGLASWYGPYFHGQQTATGEIFDENELTAAHPSLPFDTYLKVTNLMNGRSIIVRINDRGPYMDNRTLDLSREAARYLGSEEAGVVPIEAVIMEPARTSEPPTKVARL